VEFVEQSLWSSLKHLLRNLIWRDPIKDSIYSERLITIDPRPLRPLAIYWGRKRGGPLVIETLAAEAVPSRRP